MSQMNATYLVEQCGTFDIPEIEQLNPIYVSKDIARLTEEINLRGFFHQM